jgi:hypothetical protein
MAKKSLLARGIDYIQRRGVSRERAEVVFKIVSDGSTPHFGSIVLPFPGSQVGALSARR